MSRMFKAVVDPLRLVIVGGVAGGATAAARARRVSELSKIVMLERGKDISIASCGLPYHVAGEIKDRNRMVMSTPKHLHDTLNIDVRTGHNVTAIDRTAKLVHARINNQEIVQIPYDKLLLATGAAPMMPSIPGLNIASKNGRLLPMRTLEDMDLAVKLVSQNPGGQVVVVGAGFIGLEMAEALSHCGLGVTVIEDKGWMMPILDKEIAAPVTEEMTRRGVRVMASNRVVAFHDNEATKTVTVELQSGEKVNANFVIQSIGVAPESELAATAGLELGPRKSIIVNSYMQTSDPDIYAVGDVVYTPYCEFPRQKWLPLGGPANRMARIAADHMFLGSEFAEPYRGSFGTSIVRVFDAVAGKTGMTENDCIAAGIDYGVSTITGPSHASYYPGSMPLSLKVVYNKVTGKILGGQAVGGDGVDKRLDVLATAMAGNLTIEDLAHLDLAYAPPFGSARDVINTVGFAARNTSTGMMHTVAEILNTNSLVLDVRDEMTASVHPVPTIADGGVEPTQVLNIPLEQVRSRIEEIRVKALNQPVVVVCNLGKTSYFVTRILDAYNIPALSLAGGLTMLRSKQPVVLSEAIATGAPPSASKIAPTTTASASADSHAYQQTQVLDVCGLACPGPIMEIRKALPTLAEGTILEVRASDPGFYNDFPAFCRVNQMQVLSVNKKDGIVTGRLMKPSSAAVKASPTDNSSSKDKNLQPGVSPNSLALVIMSGEMDKVMAAFVLANGALAMGGKVTMFFTFWGLNALRCRGENCTFHQDDEHIKHGHRAIMDRMLSMMLPKGPDNLPLSHLQMGGLGPIAMRMQMKKKNLPNLAGLMAEAQSGGARMVACTMSMSALGVEEEDLIKGVEYGGVADFLEAAGKSQSTLFI